MTIYIINTDNANVSWNETFVVIDNFEHYKE